jgi:hypothetical protein
MPGVKPSRQAGASGTGAGRDQLVVHHGDVSAAIDRRFKPQLSRVQLDQSDSFLRAVLRGADGIGLEVARIRVAGGAQIARHLVHELARFLEQVQLRFLRDRVFLALDDLTEDHPHDDHRNSACDQHFDH